MKDATGGPPEKVVGGKIPMDGDEFELNRSPKAVTGPVNWSSISGPERLEAWLGLAAFVEGVVSRYNLTLELRPCWWQHGDAVEELTALWHFRQFSYREGAKLTDAMSWQDALHRSRGRLRDMFVSCNAGHVDSFVDKWMTEDTLASFKKMVIGDTP